MSEFTGKAKATGISLPADMWEYLELRKQQTGVPVSVHIRRLIEDDINQSARRLVDSPTQYTAESAGCVR